MDKPQKNLEIDTKKKRFTLFQDSPLQSPTPTYYHQRSSSLNAEEEAYQFKKKWYQLPRMTLKRNQSTQSIDTAVGYGGLKAGTVEPPDPPPPLPIDVDWPQQSQSTPVSRTPSRSISLQQKKTKHEKSASTDFTQQRHLSFQGLDNNNNTFCLENVNDAFELNTTMDTVLNVQNIQVRTNNKSKKKQKRERKAIQYWQQQLVQSIADGLFPQRTISEEKKSRYVLTRNFILHEFYSTEINYWNQLNYAKVMFCDPLQLAIDRNSAYVKPTDMECFSNLPSLLKLSSTIIMQFKKVDIKDIHIGAVIRGLAEHMVVFLHCALDYESNRKLMEQRQSSKGYALYIEKLSLKKETRQFVFEDYLIIPIQRITRYGLLLADLEKHTEPTHPDYENILMARYIVHSLASAMNYAQQ